MTKKKQFCTVICLLCLEIHLKLKNNKGTGKKLILKIENEKYRNGIITK